MLSTTSERENASGKNPTKVTTTDPVRLPPRDSTLFLASIPSCAKWVVGTILCLTIPLCKKILSIEDVVEREAIDVLEMVKKVAAVTEKVSSDLVEALPKDSHLKDLAKQVEDDAEVVHKDAEEVEDFTHKVDGIKDEIEVWLDRVVDEWELIMPEEESQTEKPNNPSEDASKPSIQMNGHIMFTNCRFCT
ncbi:hypothetical protein HPP92_002058 [Vanilla planifolia]|uniref:Uncharacterized protein n=1 Tax=Vanilla planifolia TaxID=51239 RepID=A0A835VME9_VANPL|nr:hypothetical protein HPP92_002058 [Vanilla planifolia]